MINQISPLSSKHWVRTNREKKGKEICRVEEVWEGTDKVHVGLGLRKDT